VQLQPYQQKQAHGQQYRQTANLPQARYSIYHSLPLDKTGHQSTPTRVPPQKEELWVMLSR